MEILDVSKSLTISEQGGINLITSKNSKFDNKLL